MIHINTDWRSLTKLWSVHRDCMGFQRFGYSLICVLAGLALGCCAHPEGHKDLLAFLQDGRTTKDEVETRIEPASVWGDGRLWTYRVGEAAEGYYLSAQKGGWSDARYSLVVEFDPNRVLHRDALIDVETPP